VTNAQLYKAIFHRKSVRKFDLAPLPSEILVRLQEYAGSVKPLDANIPYAFIYLGSAEVKNLLPIKATHYICLYSEKKANYLLNAGFVLQQIDLYLSANNLASCWLGAARPTKEVPKLRNGMEYVIMLAFGKTGEPLYRTNTSEFMRKNLSEISSAAGAEEILEPVRLAPSATNSQPWYFSGDANHLIVSRRKLNLLRAAVYGKLNQIDIGIALLHLGLSLDQQGKAASYDFAQDEVAVPKGYEFMVKVKISKKRG
jgi:hypothetical protein